MRQILSPSLLQPIKVLVIQVLSKNKKALAEVAAAGVKAAESQLLVAKAKVKKANEIVSSLEKAQ